MLLRRKMLAGSLALLSASILPGCLKRTIAISSDPEGALVWLNDVEVGRTPLETDITFYGTYDVRLRLDGFEPLDTTREARNPWYEIPPIDMVSEAIPGPHQSRIEWLFVLSPSAEALAAKAGDQAAKEAAEQDLISRAQTIRNQVGGAAPAPDSASKKKAR